MGTLGITVTSVLLVMSFLTWSPLASNADSSTQEATAWQIIMTLDTTDSFLAHKSVFSRGNFVLITATVNNVAAEPLSNIHILLTIYDSNNVPIFFAASIMSLDVGGRTSSTMSWLLASNLSPGTFGAEVIVLTDFLASGGHFIPYGAGVVAFTVT